MRCLLFLLTFATVFSTPIFSGSTNQGAVLDRGVIVTELRFSILNGAANGAAYVNIQNCENDKIILYAINIKPEVCNKVELHDHVERTDSNGNPYMQMIKIPAMEIEPGKILKLFPGSKHIMLMNINRLAYCQATSLTLTFCFRKISGEMFEVNVTVPIEKETQRCEG